MSKAGGWNSILSIIEHPKTSVRVLVAALTLGTKLAECGKRYWLLSMTVAASIKSSISDATITTLIAFLDVTKVYKQSFDSGIYTGEINSPERDNAVAV